MFVSSNRKKCMHRLLFKFCDKIGKIILESCSSDFFYIIFHSNLTKDYLIN